MNGVDLDVAASGGMRANLVASDAASADRSGGNGFGEPLARETATGQMTDEGVDTLLSGPTCSQVLLEESRFDDDESQIRTILFLAEGASSLLNSYFDPDGGNGVRGNDAVK